MTLDPYSDRGHESNDSDRCWPAGTAPIAGDFLPLRSGAWSCSDSTNRLGLYRPAGNFRSANRLTCLQAAGPDSRPWKAQKSCRQQRGQARQSRARDECQTEISYSCEHTAAPADDSATRASFEALASAVPAMMTDPRSCSTLKIRPGRRPPHGRNSGPRSRLKAGRFPCRVVLL